MKERRIKAAGWAFVVIGVACAVPLFVITMQTHVTLMNTVGIISSMLTLAAGVLILSALSAEREWWDNEEL